MPEKPPTLSFNLPEGEQVDVYVVTLADGRRVVRSAAELVALPDELKTTLADLAPPKGAA